MWSKVKALLGGSKDKKSSTATPSNETERMDVKQTLTKKNNTVVVFDSQKRIFVTRKRVARIGLYNPDAQVILLKNAQGEEQVFRIPIQEKILAKPMAGFWFDKEHCDIGVYLQEKSCFFLTHNNILKPTSIDTGQFVGTGSPADMQPLSGFWFNNEVQSIALYDQTSALFLIKNSVEDTQGQVFQYGPSNNHLQALIGDWGGHGLDSVGLYDAQHGVFFLKDSLNDSSNKDFNFHFGPTDSSMTPLVGDWDNTGYDKVGLYSAAHGLFFLHHQHLGGATQDSSVYFGPAHPQLLALAGDWSGSGQTGLGIYDPINGTAYLKNTCSGGNADLVLQFSTFESDSIPLVIHTLL